MLVAEHTAIQMPDVRLTYCVCSIVYMFWIFRCNLGTPFAVVHDIGLRSWTMRCTFKTLRSNVG